MQIGSLVTARWTVVEIIKRLAKTSPALASMVVDLPVYGQIYTVKYIGPHKDTTDITSHVEVGELVVFRFFCKKCNKTHEVGLPPDYYVEVDPPQNVQEMINKIIKDTPVTINVVDTW